MQVGFIDKERLFWTRPEETDYQPGGRPAFGIDIEQGASDLAGRFRFADRLISSNSCLRLRLWIARFHPAADLLLDAVIQISTVTALMQG